MRSHTPGPYAELDVRDHLALDPLQVRQYVHEDTHDDRGFDQTQEIVVHDWTVPPGIWPLDVGD